MPRYDETERGLNFTVVGITARVSAKLTPYAYHYQCRTKQHVHAILLTLTTNTGETQRGSHGFEQKPSSTVIYIIRYNMKRSKADAKIDQIGNQYSEHER